MISGNMGHQQRAFHQNCNYKLYRVAIINAKFQSRKRHYQPNLTFYFGGYDYWHLWILAGTALAVLKFSVCGCCTLLSTISRYQNAAVRNLTS